MLSPFLIDAICSAVLQFAGFVVAAILQTEVFYDVLGGINFLLLAGIGFAYVTEISSRMIAATVLFCFSRGWLLVFLAWRAHSRGGDSRFDEVKKNPSTFFVYWVFQAFWVYLVSTPLMVVQYESDAADTLSVVDYVLIAGFGFAIIIEISSDIQKTLWRENGRKGAFCTVGFWKYSRHPNYGGEILQWWCAAGLGAGSKWWWVGFASPVFTMIILLLTKGTGVWNAEGQSQKKYYESEHGEEYAKYRASTPPLFPMFGYEYIPAIVKRIFFFEWPIYEYTPERAADKSYDSI
jgi:steroid 5-alpha reductase family enzyme